MPDNRDDARIREWLNQEWAAQQAPVQLPNPIPIPAHWNQFQPPDGPGRRQAPVQVAPGQWEAVPDIGLGDILQVNAQDGPDQEEIQQAPRVLFNRDQQGLIMKNDKPWETTLGHFLDRNIRGMFGVEIEIEGRGIHVPTAKWSAKKEGSLRGECIEYVLHTPTGLEGAVEAVRQLRDTISENGGEVFKSYRTSTHIHINMTRETLTTMLNYIVLFTLAEPVILRECGNLRDGNCFCASSFDTGDLPEAVKSLTLMCNEGAPQAFNERGKYASLNIDHIRGFGSLEARMFPCSINPKDHRKWLTWMLNILHLARDIQPTELRRVIEQAQTNPDVFIEQVFGASIEKDYATHDYLRTGCRVAYEVYRAYKDSRRG